MIPKSPVSPVDKKVSDEGRQDAVRDEEFFLRNPQPAATDLEPACGRELADLPAASLQNIHAESPAKGQQVDAFREPQPEDKRLSPRPLGRELDDLGQRLFAPGQTTMPVPDPGHVCRTARPEVRRR